MLTPIRLDSFEFDLAKQILRGNSIRPAHLFCQALCRSTAQFTWRY